MTEPIRERRKQSAATKIVLFGLIGLALLGVVESVILLTLWLTGQIG